MPELTSHSAAAVADSNVWIARDATSGASFSSSAKREALRSISARAAATIAWQFLFTERLRRGFLTLRFLESNGLAVRVPRRKFAPIPRKIADALAAPRRTEGREQPQRCGHYLHAMPARPFSPNEINLLESHLLSDGRFRDRMLLIVGTNVGYRITELLTWTIGQVLTRDGNVAKEVTVTRALLKGGSGVRKRSIRSRRIVLNERARGAIRDYLASLNRIPAPAEFLFRSREGDNRPVHRAQAHRILKDVCRTCGIDATRISTHSLRKSFVRAVYDASHYDIVRTQRIVGHSSPQMTARYLETTQTDLDDLVLGLAAPLSAGATPIALAS